jgi:hypothetical protein
MVISGRTSPYYASPVPVPVEAEGEEDVDNVEASRSGDSVEGGPQQSGGRPANGSIAVLGEAHGPEGPIGSWRLKVDPCPQQPRFRPYRY